MIRKGMFLTTAAMTVSALILGGAGAAMADAEAVAPDNNLVKIAAEANSRGYVIVYPASSKSSDVTFYPTGPIDASTLVVVAEPDGSLPGGMSESDIAIVVEKLRDGDEIRSEARSTAEAVPMVTQWAYAATAAAWSGAYNGTNLATGWGGTAWYGFNAASGTSQRNVGQGLGYYRGYNGSVFGLWGVYYNLGSATASSNGGMSVPWDNVLATQKFKAKCATTQVCGGYYWN